jgi:diaminohydroxyphosphoribosylaminopyrimidine deaminase/5-amino-6-(5-phosphoribosylamino)uracil reductase
MKQALALAEEGLGQVAPNPSVACLIVKEGNIISQGVTAKGGRPHAETQALTQAGDKAEGSTIYVTLEPCFHQGETPPCANALIEAKPATVVVACEDPDARTAGKGIFALRNAGIEVITDVCEEEAKQLNAGFIKRITENRPLVSVKLATSLDGKLALKSGASKWITGKEARAYGHKLRAKHDAIITGIGTVRADDPMLTCRVDGMEEHSPQRFIWDSELRIDEDTQLVKTAKDYPTCIITESRDIPKISRLKDAGVEIIQPEEKYDITALLTQLAERGITRLMVEAGATLTTAFVQSGLIDHLYWFKAPILIGDEGRAAIGELGNTMLEQCQRFTLVDHLTLGDDQLSIYRL